MGNIKKMIKNRNLNFEYIYDIIEDARLKGLKIVDFSVSENSTIPDVLYDELRAIYKLIPPKDYVITIRLSKHER